MIKVTSFKHFALFICYRHILASNTVLQLYFLSMLQVIEKHYALSLGVWSERSALPENITEGESPPEEQKHPSVVMYWSLSVAIFSIGGMVSSFLVGFIGDFKGRSEISKSGHHIFTKGETKKRTNIPLFCSAG